jgi:hypothetical protein
MSRWDCLFSRRKRMMEDLNQDIRDFIERETQDNIERGMPPHEARYAALRKFGNASRVKEDTREVWTFGWLEQLGQTQRAWETQRAISPNLKTLQDIVRLTDRSPAIPCCGDGCDATAPPPARRSSQRSPRGLLERSSKAGRLLVRSAKW